MSVPTTPEDHRQAPVLVFDSGVGGLSVLAEVRRCLPCARTVYAMDSAGYPYGERSEMDIAARVPAILGRLVERFSPRIVIVACNTASTIALDAVREALDIPVVGTVPAIKPAAKASRSRIIGVLGTRATIRQAYVDRLSADFASDCTVIRYGAPELVEYAQQRLCGAPCSDIPNRAMDGLRLQPQGERIDTVVLACTHFPLVLDELAAAAGPAIAFMDGAQGIARRTAALLEGHVWPAATCVGRTVVTCAMEPNPALAAALARFGLGPPERL